MANNEKRESRDVRRKVMRLHREGWYPSNIAYIAKISQGLVEQILRDNGIVM